MNEHPGNDGPWFRRWFGEEYLKLYPHRDVAEARQAVHLLLDRLEAAGCEVGPSARRDPHTLLDLACGAGRHLQALAERGVPAVGLDLSGHLLSEAREALPDAPLLRGDMRRLPFADDTFLVVTSFFTSFGYFESEGEDRRVLREIRRVVRPGGYVLLDFLNAEQVRAELEPRDVRTIGQQEVVQQRRLVEDGRRIEKRIRISGPGEVADRHFTERVRLYDSAELVALLEGAGMVPVELLGDYEGGPHHQESPRTIVLARAALSAPRESIPSEAS